MGWGELKRRSFWGVGLELRCIIWKRKKSMNHHLLNEPPNKLCPWQFMLKWYRSPSPHPRTLCLTGLILSAVRLVGSLDQFSLTKFNSNFGLQKKGDQNVLSDLPPSLLTPWMGGGRFLVTQVDSFRYTVGSSSERTFASLFLSLPNTFLWPQVLDWGGAVGIAFEIINRFV